MVSSRYRRLTVVVCIGMLLVLLAGALVTNTGSGRGCGDDWPLCHGKFIPAYTLESMLEYSHRAVSAAVGFLVLALFIATLLRYRRHGEAVLYTSSALFFTILQALLGAAAVMWPQSPSVMALHFGFSLLAFASTMLIVLWAYRRRTAEQAARAERLRRVPRSVLRYSWALFAYTYVVVYVGAFIRHTKTSGGCGGDWPLCNGAVIPELSGASGLVFTHRVLAIVLVINVIILMVHLRRLAGQEELTRVATWMAVLVVVQVFSGALLTVTLTNENVYIFTGLLHNVIISLFFGLLADVCIQAWKHRGGRA
ncbi:heme A synthase [Paenibacillus sp. IB182496]|uniref:Heme A synthase n=1 Tax=Paenibacillus sabuli TaxID=2772509 RepID=A0A927BS00_9BACL|nr:heme A synthase [Paenibacillus sabuli]